MNSLASLAMPSFQQQRSLPPMIHHLSASSIGLWLRCQEQFRHRYILGEKERPGEAALLGSAEWDTQVKGNFAQKQETGTDRPLGEMEEFFVDEFDRAVERNGGAQDVAWNTTKADAQALGLRMMAAYHTQVSPRLQPVEVEQKLEIQIEGVEVPVLGFVDMVAVPAEHGIPAESGIIEHKTSAKKMTAPKPEWRIQGRLYQLAKQAPINWHIVTKTKTVTKIWTPLGPAHPGDGDERLPDLRIEYSQIAAKQTERLVKLVAQQISAVYETVGPDEPWAGTGLAHTWACGFCGWRPSCVWWNNQ